MIFSKYSFTVEFYVLRLFKYKYKNSHLQSPNYDLFHTFFQ